MKKLLALLLTGSLVGSLVGCGPKQEAPQEVAASTQSAQEPQEEAEEPVEMVDVQVFIAASLSTVMDEIASEFAALHPEANLVFNADSSGTLQTQIMEGYECDVFFSAGQKQMNALEEEGLLVEGTRANVLNNQLVVIKRKDTESDVTGLSDIGKAKSIALADGSVPVGKYTRTALMNLGILDETETPEEYTTEEVSNALGGVEISEQGNVSKVLMAVIEGSCEVGTTYYSDTYGYEDDIEIIEVVSYDATGNIIYPIAQVVNAQATEAQTAIAKDLIAFILSDDVKPILQSYYFDTDVE